MEPEPPPGDVSLEDFAAGPFRRLTAHLIEGFFGLVILVWWWLLFPYFLWWLFALARGQSPGKQLTGSLPCEETAHGSAGAGCFSVRVSEPSSGP